MVCGKAHLQVVIGLTFTWSVSLFTFSRAVCKALWKCRTVETVEKSKSQNDFSTVPTALGNPAKYAGFPHSHSADGYYLLPSTDKNFTLP